MPARMTEAKGRPFSVAWGKVPNPPFGWEEAWEGRLAGRPDGDPDRAEAFAAAVTARLPRGAVRMPGPAPLCPVWCFPSEKGAPAVCLSVPMAEGMGPGEVAEAIVAELSGGRPCR